MPDSDRFPNGDPQGLQEKWRVRAEDMKPVKKELAAAGIVTTESSLLGDDPVLALQILSKHIRRDYLDVNRHWIVLQFGEKEGIPYWNDLVQLYKEAVPESQAFFMDGLAATLCELAMMSKSKPKLEELTGLLRDRSRGTSRILLLRAFRRKKDPVSVSLIQELSTDPQLKTEIGAWKRK